MAGATDEGGGKAAKGSLKDADAAGAAGRAAVGAAAGGGGKAANGSLNDADAAGAAGRAAAGAADAKDENGSKEAAMEEKQ